MSWTVTFDRIGRNHNVPPLAVEGDDADELAQAVYRTARPHLASRDVSVSVDLDSGRVYIHVGKYNGGTGRVEVRP